ncbi:plasmid pRiA4b ORF-3 family protein [Streptomyces sp. NPDC006544]|uniref:plasmid pRiA4b ORF-3 family protein n=1 Tax=Streptomyces sp. NPDC006544 TaxID=3154583 RepID=UPI0033AE9C8A
MPADSVLQIKVTLADIHPPIWRRLQVPADLKLARLHLAIQTAMGWRNYHMHLFATRLATAGYATGNPVTATGGGRRWIRSLPPPTIRN